jgi:hypothetical protein
MNKDRLDKAIADLEGALVSGFNTKAYGREDPEIANLRKAIEAVAEALKAIREED